MWTCEVTGRVQTLQHDVWLVWLVDLHHLDLVHLSTHHLGEWRLADLAFEFREVVGYSQA